MNALLPAIKFNGGGHLNHTIFWTNMAPGAGGEPSGSIAEMINRDFGSFQSFKVRLERGNGDHGVCSGKLCIGM